MCVGVCVCVWLCRAPYISCLEIIINLQVYNAEIYYSKVKSYFFFFF